MFLIHNEQTKLTAGLCNALAASLVTAGVFAPAIAVLYGLSQPAPDALRLSLVTCGCFSVGTILHLVGRRMLRRLQQ